MANNLTLFGICNQKDISVLAPTNIVQHFSFDFINHESPINDSPFIYFRMDEQEFKNKNRKYAKDCHSDIFYLKY